MKRMTQYQVSRAIERAEKAGIQFIISADGNEARMRGKKELENFVAPLMSYKAEILNHFLPSNKLPAEMTIDRSVRVEQRKAADPEQIGKQTFKAIATTYRQYEFRSRLEAKWAAFFDLCKWRWSYEPLDFNGWIPDFAIGERPVLVEVKPFLHQEEFKEAIDKVIASGCTQNVILLGADPTWIAKGSAWNEAPHFGWLLEPFRQGFEDFSPHHDRLEWTVHDLHFGVTEGNDLPGLCTMAMAWVNQIWKLDCKPGRVWLDEKNIEPALESKWAIACNISKWVPTRNGGSNDSGR